MDNFKHPYTQSIRFTADGFCLCYSNESNEVISHTTQVNYRNCTQIELTNKLISAMNSTVFNNRCETTVIFDTNYFSAIPVGVFDEKDYQHLLKFIYTDYKADNHEILSTNISEECMLIYAASQLQLNSVKNLDLKTTFSNQFSEMAHHSKHNAGNFIICNLEGGFANIMCFENRSVLLVNRYECPTPEDTLYYLIQASEAIYNTKANEAGFIISGANTNDRKLISTKLTQTVFI